MAPEVEALFHELADLSPDESERRLRASAAPEAVRQEVRQLLKHDGAASVFLREAVGGAMEHSLADASAVGQTAGVYRLVRALGQGGMGSVYLGERADGTVRQQAAIKLIRPHAAATPGLLDRFLRERQILASLSHPNIAPLLDAGVTAGGVPFFAMEYCDGEPVDAYCERNKLSPAGVLRLFLPVCEAVSYAHQRMIVHRDLKPSNILIARNGVPKLLDFGIAKVLDEPAIDETRTNARMLTIHYASPEQIRGEPVSAASDVYALGAVLYRLLTGRYAHEAATDLDLQNAILASEPAKPRTWNAALPRDLENIVMMALRREPARRYATVDALAEDVRRWLEHRPVQATPASFAYRAGRFLRRNPAAAAASFLAVASMAGGTAFSVREARHARQRLDDVRQMATVFLFDFEKSIRHVPGTLEARHKVIDTARGYLEKIAPQAGNDPAVLREVADAYRSLADVQWTADVSRQGAQAAEQSLAKSLELRRRLGDRDAADPARLLAYIETGSLLATRSTYVGDMATARDAGREAMDLAKRWLAREPEKAGALRAAAAAFRAGGLMLEAEGQAVAAREAMERSYRAAVKLPAGPEDSFRLALSARNYAEILVALKKFDEAIEPAETAAAAGARLLASDPRNFTWRNEAGRTFLTTGSAHRAAARGKNPEHLQRASEYLGKAIESGAEWMRLDPQNNQGKDTFIVSAHRLARLRETQSRFDDAAALYQRARAVARELLARDPGHRRYQYLMGNNLLNAGSARLRQQRLPAAAELLAESESWLRKTLDREPNDAVAQENLISVHLNLALIAEREKRIEPARARWRLAMAEAKKMIARDPAAKAYIGDYEDLEKLGRRLGEL